jgi:hypothetical protein
MNDHRMASFDLAHLGTIAQDRRHQFADARPFPHLVIESFLRPDVARALAAEFPAREDGWTFYHHVNERKRGFNDLARLGPVARAVVAELNGPAFLAALGTLTGMPALVADPVLEGGGLAEVGPGGWVNVHADFLSHSRERTWTRRLNLIVFLNENWGDADGGALELWDREVRAPVVRILPTFNRAVVFATTSESFHGVPTVRCGPDRSRKSLALYYFEDEGTPRPVCSTRYVPRPDDGPVTRALIHLDRLALHGYARLKRRFPFADRLASRLLRRW